MNQFNESAQPHLADFIQRYEEMEEAQKALHDDQDPLPLHEPVKMTKADVKVLQNKLYKIVYGA